MVQNISNGNFYNNGQASFENEGFYNSGSNKKRVKRTGNIKEIISKHCTKQNIVLYIITFLISMVGFNNQMDGYITPFGIAMIAAVFASRMQIGILYILTIIATRIGFGTQALLKYLLTTAVFFVLVASFKPKIDEKSNGKMKIGKQLFISCLGVQLLYTFFSEYYLYDLLVGIMVSISVYVFYRIFLNGISVINEFGAKSAFPVDEIMGCAILLAITFAKFDNLNIFGYSVKNILSIMVVLILGWKNGILMGATGGITIGIILGIITGSDTTMIASYAISRNDCGSI